MLGRPVFAGASADWANAVNVSVENSRKRTILLIMPEDSLKISPKIKFFVGRGKPFILLSEFILYICSPKNKGLELNDSMALRVFRG